MAGILWGLSLHLHMESLETQKCNFYTPYMLLDSYILLHSGVSRYCLIHFSLFKKIQLAFFTTKKEPLWPFFLLLRHIHLTQRTSPITTPFFSKLSIAFENFLLYWKKSYKQFPLYLPSYNVRNTVLHSSSCGLHFIVVKLRIQIRLNGTCGFIKFSRLILRFELETLPSSNSPQLIHKWWEIFPTLPRNWSCKGVNNRSLLLDVSNWMSSYCRFLVKNSIFNKIKWTNLEIN